LNGAFAHRVVSVAEVEAEARFGGDDVSCARVGRDIAHCRDHAGFTAGRFLHRQHKLGRGTQSVPASLHWHGAGVPGLADEAHADAALASDGRDDTDGQTEPLKYRSLLDVHLAVPEQNTPVVAVLC